MIQITPHMRIIVCRQHIDFRKGIDGLCQVCRGILKEDPDSGALFVFRNRRKTCLRVLVYDGQGFWLCHKRLSVGRFKWWPDNERELSPQALHILLAAGDPNDLQTQSEWKSVKPVRSAGS